MKQDEHFFRDLVENANDLIQSVSPEGRFLYVNRAWLNTLGYDAEEVPRLNVEDVIHPDCLDHCRRVMAALTQGKSVVRIEADFRAKDGRRVAVEGSASCRFDEGRPTSTRGIFRDVSDRKRAEEEIDRLFELSLDLLCVAGTDGYFKRINPAFERVLGYSAQELLGRPFVGFVHPEDRELTDNEVVRLAGGQPVVDFQNRYLAKDGSVRWLSWRSAPAQELGRIYAVARDITDERKIQERLKRQTAELERSNAALAQFAYVASHDLRAPLRAIANLAEWLEEDLSQPAPEKAAKHLEQLRRRVARMETLTEDLLLYSRAAAETRPAKVDVAAMVRDLVFLLGPPDTFVVEVVGELPVFDTNKAALEQVLRNLLGNAIKHHDRPDGRIEISALERDRFYEFRVSDDGPGIPPEHRERVFEMFHKLESRDEVEGTGMGLALVRRLVDAHGGQIRVESGGGGGATFHFTWPRQIEPHGPGADEEQDADDTHRR